ncbi:MAG: aminodeoxychorismate/anthranilate synthase component II [Bauldia sp.]
MRHDNAMNVLVIDNYDSFTYNLVHYLGELGAKVTVRRNDRISVAEVKAMDPDAIVISPGPCTPNEAGICLSLIETVGADIPTFGVCLGYQAMGQVYGGTVTRAPTQMHGKLSEITHNGRGVFRGINGNFNATRYHSLQVAPETMPPVLEVTATANDGVVMGAMHRTYPVHGVQFHPESIASEHGHLVLKNFLDIAADWNRKHRALRSVA